MRNTGNVSTITEANNVLPVLITVELGRDRAGSCLDRKYCMGSEGRRQSPKRRQGRGKLGLHN